MSGNTITAFPKFLWSQRQRPAMIDITPAIPPENDLEVLAQLIREARNLKVIADGDKIKADERAIDAQAELEAAILSYEKEVSERGLLCRR